MYDSIHNMKAILISYAADTPCETALVELPDHYDGDPYGDTVPFCVGSNQELITLEDIPATSTLNIDPQIWLAELFECQFCEECAGDTPHHVAIPLNNNWFAKCKYPPDEKTGKTHPVIQTYKKDNF